MTERTEAYDLPLSIWPTCQRPARYQRQGRYVPEANTHPAKMLPAIAAQAIETYTEPGETVLDPMCGIGTTMVEAAYLGRYGIGIEYESHWAELARANLAHAAGRGADGTGRVINTDARHAPRLLMPDLRGRVALLLTSPPYGAGTHGHLTSSRDSGQVGIAKRHHRYGTDKANLAHRGVEHLLTGFTEILTACQPLLAPGGIVAITTRPFRHDGELIDFPAATFTAAEEAGFVPIDRLVVLLTGLRDDRLVPRPSFFALNEVRKARARGEPRSVVAHEDLLVLQQSPGATVIELHSSPPADIQHPGQSTEQRRAA